MEQMPLSNCRYVTDLLDDYLDHELPLRLTITVEAHLRRCPDCAARLQEQQSELSAIRNRLRRVPAPNYLLVKVTHALDAVSATTCD